MGKGPELRASLILHGEERRSQVFGPGPWNPVETDACRFIVPHVRSMMVGWRQLTSVWHSISKARDHHGKYVRKALPHLDLGRIPR